MSDAHSEPSLNLGHLAEEFAKLLADEHSTVAAEDTIVLEEGERREVTILFLDLVGYTRLAERLDPEQLKFVVSNTLQLLHQQIKRCGGGVEKFIGDAIMAIFGRSFASEDDSRRAVAAAFAILGKLDDVNGILASKGIALKARIGINRGLIVTGQLGEHDTVTGEAINIAQRLESNAPENGILISKTVYDDCAEYYDCAELPPLFVKNKTEPLTVYQPLQRKAGVVRHWNTSELLFVGRDAQCAELHACWERAATGRQIVMMRGDAGIGKSALARHVVNNWTVETARARVMWVSADSFGMTPYHVLTELIQQTIKWCGGDFEAVWTKIAHTQNEEFRTAEKYLRDLLGVPLSDAARAELSALEPRARQTDMLLACKRWCEAFAQHDVAAGVITPFVVMCDNVQWLPEASRDALVQLLRMFDAAVPSLWCLLERTSDTPLNLTTDATFTLPPLSEPESQQLLQARMGGQIVPALVCRRMYEQSGGNPLFLSQLANELSQVMHEEGVNCLQYIPSSMRSLLLSRLDRLEKSQKQLVQMTALAGRECTRELLTHILQRTGATKTLEELLDPICALDLLRCDDDYVQIAQPLLGEIAYSSILHTNRRKIHTLVAQWVETHRPDVSRYAPYLAEQWERAEVWHRAFQYLRDAGLSAKRRNAYRDAAPFLERAAHAAAQDITINGRHVQECHLALLDIYDVLGNREALARALDHATTLVQSPNDPNTMIVRLRQIEFMHRFGERELAPIQLREFLAEPALATAPDVHLRALLTATSFAAEHGEDDTPHIEAAQKLREKISDPHLLFVLDNNIFNHYKNANELPEAEAALTRLIDTSRTSPYSSHLCDLLFASLWWDRGDHFDDIHNRAARAAHYYEEIGWMRGVGWGAFYQLAALWRQSEYTRARAVGERVLAQLTQANDHYMCERIQLLLAAVMLFSGDRAAYDAMKRDLLERASENIAHHLSLRRECAMFEAQVLTTTAPAAALYAELQETGEAPLQRVELDEYAVTRAYVAALTGAHADARAQLDRVVSHVQENQKTWIYALALRVEGLLAAATNDRAQMDENFSHSAMAFHQLGAEFDAWLTYRWWLAMTTRATAHTDDPRATTHIRHALAQYPQWSAPEGTS